MGCSSCNCNANNTKNLGKKYFIEACKIFKDFMGPIIDGDSLIFKLNCYIVLAKSIPNFISLIKKYNILTKLENENLENDDTLEYEIESNIEIISNYSQYRAFIEQNKDKDEDFILVNDKFLKFMKKKSENYKKISAYFDSVNSIKEIIFDSHNIIKFRGNNFGIYQFFPIEVSSIKGSNNNFMNSNNIINSNNTNGKLILNNNKLDTTFEKLKKADIIKSDSKIVQELNRNGKSSNLSNLIKNIADSKSGLS